MKVPDDCKLPPFGHLMAWSRSGWAGGAWHVVDWEGKILTTGNAFHCARVRRTHRRAVEGQKLIAEKQSCSNNPL